MVSALVFVCKVELECLNYAAVAQHDYFRVPCLINKSHNKNYLFLKYVLDVYVLTLT